jgi:hypothetical protein
MFKIRFFEANKKLNPQYMKSLILQLNEEKAIFKS